MKVYANGGWREVTSAKVFVGGAWRRINRAQGYISGAWRNAVRLASTLTATTDPSYATTYVAGSPYGYGSGSTRAVPSGGIAPYTYVWSVSSFGGAVTPSVATTDQANVIVDCGAETNSPGYVQMSVTVTDAIGQTTIATADFSFINIMG